RPPEGLEAQGYRLGMESPEIRICRARLEVRNRLHAAGSAIATDSRRGKLTCELAPFLHLKGPAGFREQSGRELHVASSHPSPTSTKGRSPSMQMIRPARPGFPHTFRPQSGQVYLILFRSFAWQGEVSHSTRKPERYNSPQTSSNRPPETT